MSEHINVKVLTLNCWGIPGNIPTISSPVRKERFQAIADFISVQDYDFVFLQVLQNKLHYRGMQINNFRRFGMRMIVNI